jgi:hypothetical protein
MLNEETLLPESIYVALAGRQVSRCGPDCPYRLTGMGFFDIIFAGIPHVFMDHTSAVQYWAQAYPPIPGILVPSEAGRQMCGHELPLRVGSSFQMVTGTAS